MQRTLLDELRDGEVSAPARIAEQYARAEDEDATTLLDGVAALAAEGDERARSLLIGIVVQHRLAERAIRRVLLDPNDVDDALQNTLIAIAEKIDRFEGRSRFTTWLHTVARNEALMVLRRKQRPTENTVEVIGDEPGFVQRLSSVIIDRSRVQAAIASLPEMQRQVLLMREFEGLDYAEIAERLDLPIGTVRSRINRARSMLAETLLGTSSHT